MDPPLLGKLKSKESLEAPTNLFNVKPMIMIHPQVITIFVATKTFPQGHRSMAGFPHRGAGSAIYGTTWRNLITTSRRSPEAWNHASG